MATEFPAHLPNLSFEDYFESLRDDLGVRKVYYPACGKDYRLSYALDPNEVVYLDNEAEGSPGYVKPYLYTKANLTNPPFRDGVFDAIFVQDVHFDYWELSDTLRTLREGGFVVFSRDDCGKGVVEKDLMTLLTHGALRVIDPPFTNDRLVLFQKTAIGQRFS